MRFAFVNPGDHDYDAETPFERALAGVESAQVYLAVALAARGHEVTLYTATSRAGPHRGVTCRNFARERPERWDGFNAVFLTNATALGHRFADMFGPTRLFLWNHDIWHPPTGERMTAWMGPQDVVVCVSNWHKLNFIQAGNLPAGRIRVLRNAISPCFESLFAADADILAAKPAPVTLAFTSSPYKGLAPAIAFFRVLSRDEPAVQFKVFSGFGHYPPSNALRRREADYQPLLQECRDTPGIIPVGLLPQAELAAALRATHILFYPNIAPETASIAVMEAMAAGCRVVTSRLGALAETLSGFGQLVDFVDQRITAEPFVAAARADIRRFRAQDATLAEELRRQVGHARTALTWDRRAQEVEAWAR